MRSQDDFVDINTCDMSFPGVLSCWINFYHLQVVSTVLATSCGLWRSSRDFGRLPLLEDGRNGFSNSKKKTEMTYYMCWCPKNNHLEAAKNESRNTYGHSPTCVLAASSGLLMCWHQQNGNDISHVLMSQKIILRPHLASCGLRFEICPTFVLKYEGTSQYILM